MQPFRFLHTADLHLGTPFRGLGKYVSNKWLQKLREASYGVFARIVDVAIREQVQFVTIAGDLFDVAEVPMAVQFELRRGFETLETHGIPVFVCHGNHDPLRATRPLQWPANVCVFDAVPHFLSDEYVVPSSSLHLGEGTTVQVSGFSYASAEMTQSLAKHFVRSSQADFSIALYHGVVGAAGEHANYCATKLETLVHRNYDFWGLGHIHKPGILHDNHPTVLYPGNPQGRHAKEDGFRGVVLVDVDETGGVKVQRALTSTVQWMTCTVDVEDVESLDEGRRRILDAIRACMTDRLGMDYVLRVELQGSTSLHSQLLDDQALREVIQEDVEYLRLPVLVERVAVQTSPPLDVDALRHSEEFIGEFMRLIEDYKANLHSARQKLSPVLSDVFHPANELAFDALSDEDVRGLLDDALKMVLKQLTIEGVTG